MLIAHFGTFDVENYGDLLFPLLLERRLAESGFSFLHVSPLGTTPAALGWSDVRPSVDFGTALDRAHEIGGVVIGGGHTIHLLPTRLSTYAEPPGMAWTAYASLWLGAAFLAAARGVRCVWNTPGVPNGFVGSHQRLARWALDASDYVAVRDPRSAGFLTELPPNAEIGGATKTSAPEVAIAPDTAIDVSRLWDPGELDTAYRALFARAGREVPERTIALQIKPRFIADEGLSTAALATELDALARAARATPLLLAIGPVHGDDELAHQVAAAMKTQPLVVDRPRELRSIAAAIARSVAYVGASLHGALTALSFQRPALIVAPDRAAKFDAQMAPFRLAGWRTAAWDGVAGRVPALLSRDRESLAAPLAAARPTTERHWARLTETLCSPRPIVEARRALDEFRTLSESIVRFGDLLGVVVAGVAEQREFELREGRRHERREAKRANLDSTARSLTVIGS